MTAFALPYSLHVLAALVWVGGMFFAWMVLRPAAATVLEGPARLQLWVEVFPRFFSWVWISILVLAVSGVGMLHMHFGTLDTAPRHVQVMIGGGIAMFALFMRIQSLLLPELRKAVEAGDWAAGAAALGRIRKMVGINLLLGITVVLVAASRLSF
ncbi:CopD family protein [Pseudomonas sp. 148P]|uniref:CopD family protein n=1 Tax=Pseudomonas ulcerans TaxID=3115852 RepID=A0ABU7HM62_9PSED|nr:MULTISPECIES: CopD family protein [unclassified Pseudomonas]MEE1925634.1 CopD family protein [Pseudomonas sp. 147P]MEE1932614.1 CopD family protein [Pseudomonas sp. 148P]